MKVSIIIPFHKGITYLEDCLQSLIVQTYQDREVILVLDHVKEELESLLSVYHKELNLTVATLPETSMGVAAARNLGITLAKGDYIYFLDSDDYLDENTLMKLMMDAFDFPDIVFGEIKNTWFKRSSFLANPSEYTNETSTEENEYDTSDTNKEEEDEDTENENNPEQNDIGKAFRNTIDAEILRNNADVAYHSLITGKKGLKDISVLNIIMKRTLITNNNLLFYEKAVYLSDYPFLIQVLYYANSYYYQQKAVYIKRKHNDPINLPSLSQRYSGREYMEYIDTFRYTIGLQEITPELNNFLYQKLFRYYETSFIPRLCRATDQSRLQDGFDELHKLMLHQDDTILKGYHGYRKRLLQALIGADRKKATTIAKLHFKWKKAKKLFKNKNEFKKFLYKHLFLRKSVKDNWVLCESFFGKSYSDSPKYIYEYISKNYPGRYRFIWVMNKKQTEIPYRHKKIRRYSLFYYYYLARCKYHVFNGRQPIWVKKRRGNIFVQTWHGTPLKRLVFDMEDVSSATARYKKQVYSQSRAWDYLIAPNQYSSDIFKKCFLYNKEMLETGYPRNDILHTPDKKLLMKQLKKRLLLPSDKKIILYAPTWRDDEFYQKGKYKFQLQLDLQLLKKQLKEEYIILLRTHYFIADQIDMTGLEGFAYDFSKYDDIAQLYLISDLLITDYSSVFFDYANLRRPMLFFMYDLEKYRDVLRGFYIDIEEELPGPILNTSQEVLKAVLSVDLIKQKYNSKYEQFYYKYCSWEKGNASEKVAHRVFGLESKSDESA
jgi:Putative glycosyl/glycerophosphate transferases involved in teichoic acid biosynthesis TagF/TagB/EpsJ/RodC